MVQPGFLVVLSGPSGVGKNTLLNEVMPLVPDLLYSVSATTRPARSGEVDGEHYFFVSDSQFDEMERTGQLLESAEFVGRKYGTPRAYIEENLQLGNTVIMDIDIQGARQIRGVMPEAVFVFLLPPSFEELNRRIHDRGLDSPQAIEKRLSSAHDELQAVVDYDYAIINDDLTRAAEQLRAIIVAERCRVARSDYPGIVSTIGKGDGRKWL